MLKIGTLVNNRYGVDKVIGMGGMSRVYGGTDRITGAPIAIKEASRTGIQNQQVVQLSLAAEGMLLKSLRNPHLPHIYDVIETPESIMIVMDYVQGESLDKIVEKCGMIDAASVIEWAIQICEVLSYLHSQTPPIIYRDMKPANVILRPDGFVMMIDFGTARRWTNGNRTSDTILIGTEGFAAPEQYGGLGQSDARTDIFCLGATMFNLVTGHNPYEKPFGVTKLGTWIKELDGTPIDKVIQKCVAVDPNERFQNADELKEALMGIRGNKANTGMLSRLGITTKKSKGWQAPLMETSDPGAGQNIKPVSEKRGLTKGFAQISKEKGSVKPVEPAPVQEAADNNVYTMQPVEVAPVQIGQPVETEEGNSSKSMWKLIMISGFAGAAVVLILGLIILLTTEGSVLLPGIIMLVLLVIVAGIGVFALSKYIK